MASGCQNLTNAIAAPFIIWANNGIHRSTCPSCSPSLHRPSLQQVLSHAKNAVREGAGCDRGEGDDNSQRETCGENEQRNALVGKSCGVAVGKSVVQDSSLPQPGHKVCQTSEGSKSGREHCRMALAASHVGAEIR